MRDRSTARCKIWELRTYARAMNRGVEFSPHHTRSGSSEFGHPLCGDDETIPVLEHVVGGAALGSHHLRYLDCGDHFDRVPGTDRQLVRIALLGWDVDAHFAADTALDVDLAPRLQDGKSLARHLVDAVHRTNLQARLAPGAVVGVNDGNFFGKLFPRSAFRHIFDL